MDSNECLRTKRCVLWGERWQIRLDDLGDYLCFYESWVRCKIAQDANGVNAQDVNEDFINHINSSHSTIKFTHEFSKSHISFLDITVSLDNNNKISTDLFVKSTDTHQYLLHTSCHPSHIKKSIPFSLTLRIRRICSTTEKFKQRTNELLEFLCKRGHRLQYVQSQINKTFQMPRRDTLFTNQKQEILTDLSLLLLITLVFQTLKMS